MKDQKRKHFGNVFIKYGVGGGGLKNKNKTSLYNGQLDFHIKSVTNVCLDMYSAVNKIIKRKS